MKRILICFIVSIMLFMEGILPVQASQSQKEPLEISGLVYDHSMELDYAEQFSVDYYKDGYALITIADKDRFLVVPEGKKAPESLDETIAVIQQPVQNIYLVATSAMNLFCALDGLDHISLPAQMQTAGILKRQKKLWRMEVFLLQENTALLIMN